MRVPGSRIATRDVPRPVAPVARVAHTMPELELGWPSGCRPPWRAAGPDDEAAVIFTSGATGPAKGVLYRHRQVRAQLELIRQTYGITADDRIVAAFAPFALYGPALGVPSAVPATDVTQPGTLTAAALADAAVGRRRHGGLRLAGRADQCAGHRRRADRRTARRAGPGAAADERGRAGSGRAAAPADRGAARTPSCTPPTG